MAPLRATNALLLLPALLLHAALFLAEGQPVQKEQVQEKQLQDSQQDYENWFRSANGLNLGFSDAAALASSEFPTLQDTGVNVAALQALRDALYNSLRFTIVEVRQKLLPLAYQHTAPKKLVGLFTVLSVGASSGGLGLPLSEAQSRAVELALRKAEPAQLQALYQVLYSPAGQLVDQLTAQTTALEQAAAGADAATYRAAFLAARQAGATTADCLEQASYAAVRANLAGLVRRYAKDAVPYTVEDFQKYYGINWRSEWLAAPFEQRVARDQHAYTTAEFAEYFGGSWVQEWTASREATQVRIAQDKKKYTIKEFKDYFGNSWQQKWAAAPETRCQECGPYPAVVQVALPLIMAKPQQVEKAVQLQDTPQDYENWFRSSSGLSLGSSDAAALARSEFPTLQATGVTVAALQQLRDALYRDLGLSIAEVRQKLLPLAYQHVASQKLVALYNVLSGNWWTSGGLALAKADAQSRAVELAVRKAEPEQLRALYEVLYGAFGLQLDKTTSQTTAIEQAAAGADSATYKDAYLAAKKQGASPADCLLRASQAAVKANLAGLVRRYAKDAVAYSAEEFQRHYGNGWLSEWLVAPFEQRVARDQRAYTTAEFAEYFGSSWVQQWANSKEATQVRIAQDKKQYTLQEFKDYYGNSWQQQWASAPETRCQECGPYPSVAKEGAPVVVV